MQGWFCREDLAMNMQTNRTALQGMLNNVWAQIGLLAGVVVILIVLAARYVW